MPLQSILNAYEPSLKGLLYSRRVKKQGKNHHIRGAGQGRSPDQSKAGKGWSGLPPPRLCLRLFPADSPLWTRRRSSPGYTQPFEAPVDRARRAYARASIIVFREAHSTFATCPSLRRPKCPGFSGHRSLLRGLWPLFPLVFTYPPSPSTEKTPPGQVKPCCTANRTQKQKIDHNGFISLTLRYLANYNDEHGTISSHIKGTV